MFGQPKALLYIDILIDFMNTVSMLMLATNLLFTFHRLFIVVKMIRA